MIINSISELNESKIETKFPKEFTHDNIQCKWFNLEETMKIKEADYVPGIKELIPKAYKLYNLNQKI